MWRFVHITDPHLASKRDGVWNNRFLCSMVPEVMTCLGRDLAQLMPDFMLVTGDIVSCRTRAAVFQARDALDSLGAPYYPMGGNHDHYSMEARAWFLEAYAKHLPTANTVYSFVHKNLRFCVLDPWWVWDDEALMPFASSEAARRQDSNLCGMRWALPPEQFVWLESVLNAFPDLPTCLAFHYPAMAVPERFWREEYKDAGALENGSLLVETVLKYPHVKAVFAGHLHSNIIVQQEGLYQIVTSALAEYPVEYREVQVYDDRMEIHTRALSDPSFAERSRIPGHEFTRGTEEDRTAVIPFT